MEEALSTHAKIIFIISMIIWIIITKMTNIDDDLIVFTFRLFGAQTNTMLGGMAIIVTHFFGFILTLYALAGSWYLYLVLKDKTGKKMSSETPRKF